MRPELDETQPAADDRALDRTATQEPGAPPAASTEGALVPNMRLGHFKIERKLGAGGMGEVYLATDLALDRPVAIKVLPSGAASGSARERLIKEARAQAAGRLAWPIPVDVFTGLGIAAAVGFFALLLHASLRVPGKRAPWDRVSGTVVRYRTMRGSTGAVT